MQSELDRTKRALVVALDTLQKANDILDGLKSRVTGLEEAAERIAAKRTVNIHFEKCGDNDYAKWMLFLTAMGVEFEEQTTTPPTDAPIDPDTAPFILAVRWIGHVRFDQRQRFVGIQAWGENDILRRRDNGR